MSVHLFRRDILTSYIRDLAKNDACVLVYQRIDSRYGPHFSNYFYSSQAAFIVSCWGSVRYIQDCVDGSANLLVASVCTFPFERAPQYWREFFVWNVAARKNWQYDIRSQITEES